MCQAVCWVLYFHSISTHICFTSPHNSPVRQGLSPILQKRKLRPRKVKQCAQWPQQEFKPRSICLAPNYAMHRRQGRLWACIGHAWEAVFGWSLVWVACRAGPGARRVSSVSVHPHFILWGDCLTPAPSALMKTTGGPQHTQSTSLSSLCLCFPKCVIWDT